VSSLFHKDADVTKEDMVYVLSIFTKSAHFILSEQWQKK